MQVKGTPKNPEHYQDTVDKVPPVASNAVPRESSPPRMSRCQTVMHLPQLGTAEAEIREWVADHTAIGLTLSRKETCRVDIYKCTMPKVLGLMMWVAGHGLPFYPCRALAHHHRLRAPHGGRKVAAVPPFLISHASLVCTLNQNFPLISLDTRGRLTACPLSGLL